MDVKTSIGYRGYKSSRISLADEPTVGARHETAPYILEHMRLRWPVKFISRYSPTLPSSAVCAITAPAKSMGVFLYLSVFLRVLDANRRKQLLAIAQKSLLACPRNSIFMPEFSSLPEPPRNSGCSWVLISLQWIIGNSSTLKSQGMISLVLDTLLGATDHDIPRIIQLLKEIRALNISLYLFDQTERLIDMSEMSDIISSDNYIDIWVRSLILGD